jgi:hypothetical protein
MMMMMATMAVATMMFAPTVLTLLTLASTSFFV